MTRLVYLEPLLDAQAAGLSHCKTQAAAQAAAAAAARQRSKAPVRSREERLREFYELLLDKGAALDIIV